TRMPTNFPVGDGGQRTSPIAGMFDAPAFAKDRQEYAQILGGDAEAEGLLSNPDAVTRALRDYVWSVGVNGGTAPVGAAPAPAPPTSRDPRPAGGAAPARDS